jgi:hypothetical protein
MKRYKFPRTPHLPISLSRTDDDKSLRDYSLFENMREVIVTEKMDGESFTAYSDGYTHARSIDSRHHESRSIAKQKASEICQLLPKGWRISCENLYARHSIGYENLKGYLYLLAVWDSANICLSYDEMRLWAIDLDLPMPDLLYRGEFSSNILLDISKKLDYTKVEGFVIRNADEFHFHDYGWNVAKFVRANHVQTDEHWMNGPVTKNLLHEHRY